jgi:hypothetical protein
MLHSRNISSSPNATAAAWKPLAIGTVICFFSATGIAHSQIFIANGNTGIIGEYTVAGAAINASLITGVTGAFQLAVQGNDLFVSDTQIVYISEYTTSGSLINPDVLPTAPGGIAFDVVGNDIFLANYEGPLSEYTTSGAVVNGSLGTPVPGAQVVDVQGNDIFVSSQLPRNYPPVIGMPQYIGEFTTSGDTINSDLLTISHMSSFTVDGDDLFVTTYTGSVAEYTTSGTLVNPSLIGSLFDPTAITAVGDDLFVASSGGIGEYTTSGATINASLISGVGTIYGLTVVVPEPATFALFALAGVSVFVQRPVRIRRKLTE